MTDFQKQNLVKSKVLVILTAISKFLSIIMEDSEGWRHTAGIRREGGVLREVIDSLKLWLYVL